MFWRRKRRAGPTGTGKIIENINWEFWDDADTPALIMRDKFSELCRVVLSDKEWGEYAVASVSSSIVSMDGTRNERAIATRQCLQQKVADHLVRARTDLQSISALIVGHWSREGAIGPEDEGLLLLKAYLNVLSWWGYPYDWRDAYDAAGHLTTIIVSKEASERDRRLRSLKSPLRYVAAPRNRIEYCVKRSEVLGMRGTPKHFTFQLSGATWSFSVRDGHLVIMPKE